MEKRLMTLAEAGMYLGIKKGTLQNLARQGIVPSVVIGSRIRRYDRCMLDRWIEQTQSK